MKETATRIVVGLFSVHYMLALIILSSVCMCVCVIFKQTARCPFLILLRNISDYEILSMYEYILLGCLTQSQILTLNKVTDFLQMRYA